MGEIGGGSWIPPGYHIERKEKGRTKEKTTTFKVQKNVSLIEDCMKQNELK